MIVSSANLENINKIAILFKRKANKTAVMNICSNNNYPQGDSLLIDMQMYLGSCPAPVGWVPTKPFLSIFFLSERGLESKNHPWTANRAGGLLWHDILPGIFSKTDQIPHFSTNVGSAHG